MLIVVVALGRGHVEVCWFVVVRRVVVLVCHFLVGVLELGSGVPVVVLVMVLGGGMMMLHLSGCWVAWSFVRGSDARG